MLKRSLDVLSPYALNESHIHLNLDSKYTLAKENMTDSVVNEFTSRLTRMNHEPVGKLHRLGTGSAELARHDNFTSLSPRFHDKPKHTIACSETKSALCVTPKMFRAHRRIASPPRSLYRKLSHCATAERPRVCTFSA